MDFTIYHFTKSATMKSIYFHLLLLTLASCCLGETAVMMENKENGMDKNLQEKFTTTPGPDHSLESESRNILQGGEDTEDYVSCYREDRKYVPIILRSEWNANRRTPIEFSTPAEFVVIRDGGERCFLKKACLSNVQSERIQDLGDACDLRENFYIGEDGNVYEGRGWDIAPYWYLDGMRAYSITVKFMGSFNSRTPNRKALRAFQSLLSMGVWKKKITSNYKIVSIDQITSGEKHIGEELKKNVMEWDGWVNTSVPLSWWEYHKEEYLNIVLRRQWNATEGLGKYKRAESNARYVLINNEQNRCFSREECIPQIQKLQNTLSEQYGDLDENFYIGEDGNVYEGRGWDVLPHWHIEGFGNSFVSVSFLGSFHSELPSYRAISAFKALIKTGISLEKISPRFKLTSLRIFYDDDEFLGDQLTRYVEKWTPWMTEFDSMTANERVEKKLVPLITRSGRGYDDQYYRIPQSFYDTRLPIQYVLIKEGGEFCFTVEECTKGIIFEKNKHADSYGDLLDSFYIGSDGNTYEGRGWEKLPPLHVKHLNDSYITVNFFGHFNSEEPDSLALVAFKSIIKIGIDLGKISPTYQLYSYRHIYNDSSFLGDALSEYAEGLEHWSTEMSSDNDEERESMGLLPLVSRADWKATSLGKAFDGINGSVQYVIVGEAGDRCFAHSQCVREMLNEQERSLKAYGSLTDHFYVGDDGNAYEGLGWLSTSVDITEKEEINTIFVRFFGRFERQLPSQMAFAAFQRLLLYGVHSKKLSENYKIISIGQLCNCSDGVGEIFHEVIEKWDRYVHDADSYNLSESIPYVRHMIVPSATAAQGEKGKTKQVFPAEYVVLLDSGERCFHREQCDSQVITERTTIKGRLTNFFAGEDGRLYGGAGWENHLAWEHICQNWDFITVTFFGNFSIDLPSAKAMRALDFLTGWGIRVGKISPDYKLISFRQICNDSSFVGDALDLQVRKWRNWSDKIRLRADCSSLFGKIISPTTWGASKPIRGNARVGPVMSIFVRDGRERCYSVQECTDLMQTEHTRVQRNYGVLENFYIGDDGNCYAGRGWHRDPQFEFHANDNSDYSEESTESPSINVLFYGRFDTENLSPTATLAFKELIVRQGIESGNLHPSFVLRAVPDGTYSQNVGRTLKENLKMLL